MRHIRRIEGIPKGTYAWVVQVQRKKQTTIKMFSDALFGGKNRALTAAIQYRDALIAAASPAEHNRWHRTILRRNNKTGTPGVFFDDRKGSPRWVAKWNDENGKQRSRAFGVNIFGQEGAKTLAIEERERQLKRLFEIKSAQAMGETYSTEELPKLFSKGIAGVSFSARKGSPSWVADWKDENGIRHRRSFSVNKYGAANAKALAMAAKGV